jgi:hypothetical protein
MSFLRRLFGRAGDDGDERKRVDERAGAHGQGERQLAEAKADLLGLLRERGARSAVIAYDGGHDEGAVTEIWISRDPLSEPPRKFAGELVAAEELELDWDTFGGNPPSLLDAAMDVVADKWGSFAGEFFVRGRLVVDVDSGAIARHDDTWVDDEDVDYEEAYDEEEQPKRPPDDHEVESV